MRFFLLFLRGIKLKESVQYAIEKVIDEHYGKAKIKSISYLSSGRINAIYKVELNDCDVDQVVVRLRHFNDVEFRTELWKRDNVRGNSARKCSISKANKM